MKYGVRYSQWTLKRNSSSEGHIVLTMHTQEVTLLILLDLSATFDTIPHNLFTEKLIKEYDTPRSPPKWLRSYFSER